MIKILKREIRKKSKEVINIFYTNVSSIKYNKISDPPQ